jgi:hypothetical protein
VSAAITMRSWRIPYACYAFVGAMLEAQPDFEVSYFLSKPWKWEAEFDAWRAAGYPENDGAPGWEYFLKAVDSL